jgi:hypothetical protein
MVDSRIELFDETTWAEYLAIAGGGPKSLEVLRGIEATVVVVDAAEQSALGLTLRTPGAGWRLAYQDADGQVFTLAE